LLHHFLSRMARGAFLIRKRSRQRVLRVTGNHESKPLVALVAGVQRSGTNMIMDILERSFETEVYHEYDPRAFDNYGMRPPDVIRSLYDSSYAKCVVIKSLCELQHLRALIGEFAPARVIWVVRKYPDVVNSMLASFRNQAQQVLKIVENRGNAGWWLGEGISESTYDVISRLAHPGMNDATGAALQWYLRNILFFEQELQKDHRVILIRYERLVTQPQKEFERLFHFMALEYTPEITRKIFATSIGKRQPPPIEEPVRLLCEQLTQRFDQIAPL